MELIALPAFQDNYFWMLHDGRQALVVDPGEAAPVLAALRQGGLTLASILVTHHHADHTGGVAELRATTGAQVYGPTRERLPEPFAPLQGGESGWHRERASYLHLSSLTEQRLLFCQGLFLFARNQRGNAP